MSKHAYLIIANNNYDQLKILINLLDYYENDIYLLIDKKSNICNKKRIKTKYSCIHYLDPIYIYWGSYSIIDAELKLFKESFNNGTYSYYHLLSGNDLPLCNQKIIHEFFDKFNGYEFIEYEKSSEKSIKDKVKPHLFNKYYNDGIRNRKSHFCIFTRLFISIYRHVETILLKILFNNFTDFSKIEVASQWMSIDNELVSLIIDNEKFIYKLFSKGKVVDELFIPTIINYNPKFIKKIYDHNKYSVSPNNPLSNLRYIEKSNIDPHPKVFTMKDYNKLLFAQKRGYLFARKFNYIYHPDIVINIKNILCKNNLLK